MNKKLILTVFFLMQMFLTETIDLQFKKYNYRYSTLVENKLKSMKKKCETDTYCMELESNDQQNCILKCLSLPCYEELYKEDPLEEGEFDVRYVSFKGCFAEHKF